jgi:hypothetical protein
VCLYCITYQQSTYHNLTVNSSHVDLTFVYYNGRFTVHYFIYNSSYRKSLLHDHNMLLQSCFLVAQIQIKTYFTLIHKFQVTLEMDVKTHVRVHIVAIIFVRCKRNLCGQINITKTHSAILELLHTRKREDSPAEARATSLKISLTTRQKCDTVWTGSIWLRIGAGGGLLWTRWWTFGFLKMLGSSWVVAQLTASQEGLSSVSK